VPPKTTDRSLVRVLGGSPTPAFEPAGSRGTGDPFSALVNRADHRNDFVDRPNPKTIVPAN